MESMIATLNMSAALRWKAASITQPISWPKLPLERFETLLKEGTPVMVAWNDWGGHWQVVIGYDTMGTETTQDDVLIVADPYDTTDHNQDGLLRSTARNVSITTGRCDFFEGQGIEKSAT